MTERCQRCDKPDVWCNCPPAHIADERPPPTGAGPPATPKQRAEAIKKARRAIEKAKQED